MAEYTILQHDKVPKPLLESGCRAIFDYTVGFTFHKRPAGSGTLVRLGSTFGILTAAHVVRQFLKEPSVPIGMVISRHWHSFGFERDERIEISVLAEPASRSDESLGPDLAFFRIFDQRRLETIGAIKSFYPLDLRNFEKPAESLLKSLPLFVAGMPSAFCSEIKTDHIGGAVFMGAAQIVEDVVRGDFDFLTVAVRADGKQFPETYKGVSGGGLWYLPLCRDPERQDKPFWHENPLLVGVAYYEMDRSSHLDLVCHGPQSIYAFARYQISKSR
jgi:hypothetical protein